MTSREKHIAEINRMTEALKNTKSVHLKKDYKKGISRLKKELAEYDRWQATLEVHHGNI